MRSATVARSYAEGVFDLAQKHNLHNEFAAGFQALNVVLGEPSVRTFLVSPKLDVKTKKTVLRAALGNRVHPLFLNFLQVVIDKRRQGILADISEQYFGLLDEAQGRMHVQVTVAREATPELQQDISARLSEIFGKTVLPHIHVDRRILGGIIVRHQDKVIDGSLRRRLLAMRRRLLEKA
jgi:F-type H+-transporting ATPase subunit delta